MPVFSALIIYRIFQGAHRVARKLGKI
jgi:hypothetical protein